MELTALYISDGAASTKRTANFYPSASFISLFADLRSLFINVGYDRDTALGSLRTVLYFL